MGLEVRSLLAIDLFRDCVGVTPLPEDQVAQVTLSSAVKAADMKVGLETALE